MFRRILIAALVLGACKEKKDDTDPLEESPLLDVAKGDSWSIPGMKEDGWVVYTDMGVPHVYASNRADLGRLVGFTLARDRFFYMDLASRLGLGTVSELLGVEALETDLEARFQASAWIADRLLQLIEDDPGMADYFDGVAAGVNAYIDAVEAGDLPPPSEFEFAAPLLSTNPSEASAVDLMARWDRRRVVGGVVTVLYESGFETKDVGRAADAARLDTVFEGAAEQGLREAGLFGLPSEGLEPDAWGRVEPPRMVASAPGWNRANATSAPGAGRRPGGIDVNHDALFRLKHHTDRFEQALLHEWITGFGSNAWAVSAEASADGRAMVATDGHLPLTIPPLFFQIGIDTQHLGGGSVKQVGMMTPAMPMISTGTNGDIAFGQTQLIGDITDWYRECLELDDDGAPASSRWKGSTEPLEAFDETFVVASTSALFGGPGFTETVTRYTTFDGRWITSIEGREVGGPEEAGEGETAVNLMGDWIIPNDEDGDGCLSAISFDYAGLDLSNMARVIDDYASAKTLEGFEIATDDLVAYSLNLVAADRTGSIFYTGFQAVPCREYLPRDSDGVWEEGADPNLLLDGTQYGGFTIPIAEGRVQFGQEDPYRCVIPYDDYPHELDPEQGYLVSANNDPGGFTFDGTLANDPVYIGGPWMEGYRADEISRALEAAIADGGVSVDDMKAIQGNHTSVLGRQLTPVLLEAIEEARTQAAGTPTGADARVAALYDDDMDRIDDAYTRLAAWQDRGWQAEHGVETYYASPTADEVQDAIATSIFNAWMGRYVGFTVNDEGIPGLGFPTGDTGRFRLLTRMLDGRGPENPLDMGSWNPATQESIYFDVRGTEPVETSTEVALMALVDALDFLESPVAEDGQGGFGSDDPEDWLWGYKHYVTFPSLLADFFGLDDPVLASVIEPFNINQSTFPMAEDIPPGDPRLDVPGFPRHGDNLCVDALNSGSGGQDFDGDYGAVWRFVVALGDGGFEAWNILPGGQSGLVDSEHFADQARLWLANEYIPVQLHVEDVAAAGQRRDVFPAAE